MHDTLAYFEQDPIYRRYHHHELTFYASCTRSARTSCCRCRTTRSSTAKGSLYTKMAGSDHVAEAGQPAHAVRLHVGPPGQEAALHGPGVRPDRRVELTSARWTGTCSRTPQHGGVQSLIRDLNRAYRDGAGAVGGSTPIRPPSGGWSPTTPINNVLAFARRSADGSRVIVVVAEPLPRRPSTAIASGCRGRCAGARCSTPTPPTTAARTSATSGGVDRRSRSRGTTSRSRPS